jgi:hypothetical protein
MEVFVCSARARFCCRVVRSRDNEAIEIFLDDRERKLKTVLRTDTADSERAICGYRLDSNGTALELFIEREGESRVLSMDEACEAALGEFMLSPFPQQYFVPATGLG